MRFLTALCLIVFSFCLITGAACEENFSLDRTHSYIGFSITFAGLTDVEGRFSDFRGSLIYNPEKLEDSAGFIVVNTASIETSSAERDKHLKTTDFFDVEKYPVTTFEIAHITRKGTGYLAEGTLQIHGFSKQLEFPFEGTRIIDNWGNARIGIRTSFDLSRKDFQLGIASDSWWNEPVTAGKLLVGDTAHVDVRIQGVIWNVDKLTSGPDSPSTVLFKTYQEKGFAEVLKQYNELSTAKNSQSQIVEDEFGVLGSKLMQANKFEEAIQVFVLGAERFPKSAYIQTKLADAYRRKGDIQLSLSTYKKALELDPNNPAATLMVKRLGNKKAS